MDRVVGFPCPSELPSLARSGARNSFDSQQLFLLNGDRIHLQIYSALRGKFISNSLITNHSEHLFAV